MLHFRMDMPLYLMALYGSIMILLVCFLSCILKNRLPKFVFPVLWGLMMVRRLIPFSISSPISVPVTEWQLPFAENNASPYVVQDIQAGTATEQEHVVYGFAESSGLAPIDWNFVLLIVFGWVLRQQQAFCCSKSNAVSKG